MNINVSGTDSMVGEYLIYRGFTQTFQYLESERQKDRTKRFEVSRIVDAIFQNLQGFEIENFINLWDFLNKRFFFHLDIEHLNLCNILKTDLLKYYLVNAIKVKSKDKITEFFTMYSHEILAESGDHIPGNLRGWFVLPYMDEPEKDAEFSVYFSQRWADLLKITLHNFLSVVLSTAPPPKLLLLERWFRSEAQQEIRTQLKLSAKKIDALILRLEKNEERLQSLTEAVKDLITYVHKANIGGTKHSSTAVGLFETDEEAEGKRLKAKELGQVVVRLASECAKKSSFINSMPPESRMKEILGKSASELFFKPNQSNHTSLIDSVERENNYNAHHGDNGNHQDFEDLEGNLIQNLKRWLEVLTP